MHCMKQANVEWQHGQPISTDFDDVYFSKEGGLAETEYVFLQNNDLPGRWKNKNRFVVAETGFGTGLNFFATVRHWLTTSEETAHLYYYSIEKYPLTPTDLKKALSEFPQFKAYIDEVLIYYPLPINGFRGFRRLRIRHRRCCL